MDDKKPQIILDYNRTKGAVDSIDKLVRTYSVIRKSRRWPMVVFGNLIYRYLAAYNAYVIFSHVHSEYEAGKSHRRRLFLGEKLALDLVRDAVAAKDAPAVAVAPVDSALTASKTSPLQELSQECGQENCGNMLKVQSCSLQATSNECLRQLLLRLVFL